LCSRTPSLVSVEVQTKTLSGGTGGIDTDRQQY
jgi:hypothetical protein